MFDASTDEYSFPPRRETFLARYPRNVKMVVTVVLLAILVLPPAWVHGRLHYHEAQTIDIASPAQKEAEKYMPTLMKTKAVPADANATALNDQEDRSVKLTPAPDTRVTEDTHEGSLPRLSSNGIGPWQVYARPFNPADKRPRLAIIVTDMGLSRITTDQVISKLPPTVTLAIDPQGLVSAAWGARARQEGHEILLQIPMEPFDYPNSDPGPNTLLTSLPDADNLVRLLRVLRRATGYVGVTTTTGSRFTTDAAKFGEVLKQLHDRGLLVLDARAAPRSVVTDLALNARVPVATVTERLDVDLSPDAIDGALNDLEKVALQSGRAVGIVSPTPIMLEHLQNWMKNLPQHGVALAPLSAMVQ